MDIRLTEYQRAIADNVAKVCSEFDDNYWSGCEADMRVKWWPEVESNHRHGDFQSPALPTELSGHNKVNAAVSPLTLLDQIDVYSAFTAVVKMTTAKKGVIKAKEVTGVK